jgi:hypothetical protein
MSFNLSLFFTPNPPVSPNMSRSKTPDLHSNVRCSFSRASRFLPLRPPSADYITHPSSFHRSRSPSFGYGKRWEPRNETGLDAPPATSYHIKSCFDLRIAGPVFRRPRRPVIRPPMRLSYAPGPGSYCPERDIGIEAPKFSMLGKGSPPRTSDTPPPGHYSPNMELLSDQRFSRISFGIGSRKYLALPSYPHRVSPISFRKRHPGVRLLEKGQSRS